MKQLLLSLSILISVIACQKEETPVQNTDAKMAFQFAFDKDQIRLNNFGDANSIPSNHASQSPDFNRMSVHYIELVPTKFTPIRDGAVVYEGKTQTAEAGSSFEKAIVWEEAIISGPWLPFLEIPISDIPPGIYQYLRASVTYQNANIRFNIINLPAPLPPNLLDQQGTLAGFIGFNTHIKTHQVLEKSVEVNADRTQGFWAFEPQLEEPYQAIYLQFANPDGIKSGQAPAGNPLQQFGIELPQGSCIVTGELSEPLVITGNETAPIKLTLSFSVNNSFAWVDSNNNGEWDLDLSSQNIEQPVDMGLRGLMVEVD